MDRARGLFDVMLSKVHLERDWCYTTEDLVGGALWVPPGNWRLGIVQQLALLPGMMRVFGRGLARAQRGLAVMEQGIPREAHYYLDSLGVVPEWQGRGIGSALMAPVLERCDRERMPAYLNAGSAAQPRAVPAARLRGHRGVPPARRRPAAVADVAQATSDPQIAPTKSGVRSVPVHAVALMRSNSPSSSRPWRGGAGNHWSQTGQPDAAGG